MSPVDYRLKKHEPFFAGCQRIACEEIAAVLQDLHACGISEDPAEAVHDARRHLKKLQALYRLVRKTIGEEAYVRERGRFHRAAQRLASARDAEVSVRTLEQLKESALPENRQALGSALEIFTSILGHHRALPQRTLDAISGLLVESSTAVRAWTIPGDGSKAMADGLEKLYRRGRKAGKRAAETPTTERLHKWRRTTKELWSALRLLRTFDDKHLDCLTKAARDLGELLGDDHDLAVLGDGLGHEQVSVKLGKQPIEHINQVIAAERKRLQRKAWKLGKVLYEEKPKKLRQRIREL
jgi:CHAD domain-containing protein